MYDALENVRELHVGAAGLWLLGAYAVFIGGTVGSFLNVVAYRLPLGMSLSRPGSRCPWCEHPIRWYHNVPVIGWLVLRGRCYDCRAPIAARYALVELLAAVAAGLAFWSSVSVVSGERGPEYLVPPLVVLFRMAMVFVLFTTALLEFDGNRLPLRLLSMSLVVAVLGASIFPELRPAPDDTIAIGGYSGLESTALLASLFALLSWPVLASSGTILDGLSRAGALILTALVLGPLALLFIAFHSGVIFVAYSLTPTVTPSARRFGWATALLAATLLWWVAGEFGFQTWVRTQLANRATGHVLVTVGAATALLAVAGRVIQIRSLRSSTS